MLRGFIMVEYHTTVRDQRTETKCILSPLDFFCLYSDISQPLKLLIQSDICPVNMGV